MHSSRPRLRLPLLLLAVLALLLASCGSSDSEGGSGGGGGGSAGCDASGEGGGDAAASEAAEGTPSEVPDSGGKQELSLRPQAFAESQTLTEAYAQFLEAKGYETSVQEPDGAFREGVYPALEDGDADIVIDYTGSAASFLDPEGKASPEAGATYDRLKEALDAKGLGAATYSPSEDKNALVVCQAFADANDLTTISDLAGVEGGVVFGGSAQCMEREDCLLGYQGDTYGLKFKSVKTLDYGPPLAAGLESGDITAAQYQTTAPEIDSGKFVVLEDDKGLLSADNIVPIFGADVADADLVAALDELSAALTTEDLIGWNVATDIDKEEPADVAEAWLTDKGLI